MGFGAQLSLMAALGFVVLGPKRMHAILGRFAQTKAELDKASRNLKSRLDAELPVSSDPAKQTDGEAPPGLHFSLRSLDTPARAPNGPGSDRPSDAIAP
jgi:Sec-independent protein translocase protein TatA